MKKRYYLVIAVLIAASALWIEFLWLTSSPDGINLIFQAKGYNVQNDETLTYGHPEGTNLGLKQFMAKYEEHWYNPSYSCCEQSYNWRKSQNPVIVRHWKGLWGNHHIPQFYWSFTANGTRYNWLIWDGNP